MLAAEPDLKGIPAPWAFPKFSIFEATGKADRSVDKDLRVPMWVAAETD